MNDLKLPPVRDRRTLFAAAGVGGLLVGLLVLRQLSGGGDDVAAGGPPPSRVPAQTTTVTVPELSGEPAPALVAPVDPFDQIVTAPEAAQGSTSAQPVQPAQSAGASVVQASQTTTTIRQAQATTTTTARPVTPAAPPQPAPAPPTAVPPPPAPAPNVVSGTVGPAAVANVAVQICVTGAPTCASTPPATRVALSVSATVDPAATRAPTLVSGWCSNGQGVAVVVNTGSSGTTIEGSVMATVNGIPTAFPVALPATGPNQDVIISACVPPGIGVPTGSGQTSTPLLTLVGGLLYAVLGLLGGRVQ